MNRSHDQFIKFGAIGVANTLLHGLVFGCFVDGLGISVVMSHLVAFCFANFLSYLLNSFVTFKAPITLRLYARFFLASMLSLIMTLGLSALAQWCGLGHWQGFALIVLVIPIFSFVLMKCWAFSKSSERMK